MLENLDIFPAPRHFHNDLASDSSAQSGPLAARGSSGGLVKRVTRILRKCQDGLEDDERSARQKKEERIQILKLLMENAETRQEWETAASELDELEGNNAWKSDPFTGSLNVPLIESFTRHLDEARANCDIHAMVHFIRTALSRDTGGMADPELYAHSHLGTKHLIERYVESSVEIIDTLLRLTSLKKPAGLTDRDLLDIMTLTRTSFGRTALVLSGGATFGMAHIGVMKALFDAKLLPRIISGTSAGSIVAAVVCVKTDEELPVVLKKFPFGDLAVFQAQDKEDSWSEQFHRLMTEHCLLDNKHLIRVMKDWLGDMTFQEAHHRTRRILNITVSPASDFEVPLLLNYITAPNVVIWSAVTASCSVPCIFPASELIIKDPKTGKVAPWHPSPRRWIDGSMDSDIPLARIAELFQVNHFIVSQANPHIVPFVDDDDSTAHTSTSSSSSSTSAAPSTAISSFLKNQLRLGLSLGVYEAVWWLDTVVRTGVLPDIAGRLIGMLSQKYTGDITILPRIDLRRWGARLVRNPTTAFMLEACLVGERAAWPKLARVRHRCAVELAVDRAILALQERVAFSSSQVNLRRLATGSGSAELGLTEESVRSTAAGGAGAGAGVGGNFGHRHRRGSGGDIELGARRQKNLMDLETLLTEDDDESGVETVREGNGTGTFRPANIAVRRGVPGMNMNLGRFSAAAAATTGGVGAGKGTAKGHPIRRNSRSLSTLPPLRSRMSPYVQQQQQHQQQVAAKSPPRVSAYFPQGMMRMTRIKSADADDGDAGFYSDDDNDDVYSVSDAGTESPVLSMKFRREGRSPLDQGRGRQLGGGIGGDEDGDDEFSPTAGLRSTTSDDDGEADADADDGEDDDDDDGEDFSDPEPYGVQTQMQMQMQMGHGPTSGGRGDDPFVDG